MELTGCVPRFVKAHGSWILTVLSALGVIGTTVLASVVTPAVQDAIDDESTDRYMASQDRNPPEDGIITSEWFEAHKDEWELSFWEKAGIAIPMYLPAILVGTATLTCIFGAQIVNAKTQAAMVAAYGSLLTQFDQYRQVIRKEYGDEADKKAFLESRKEIRALENEIRKLKEENGPFLYEFATLPGIVFEETPAQIYNALLHFNRNMLIAGSNNLAELYKFAGLPESVYDKEEASQYGWQEYENDVGFGSAGVDFMFVRKKTCYGRTVNIISTYIPPYEVDVDYGFEGDVSSHIYPGYDIGMAELYAEQIGKFDIIQIDPKHDCWIA